MQLRMLDKSMGYPKTSPIVNFGMPPSTGAVWDSGNYEADWSDAEELHMTIKKLPSADFELLVLHYVQCKCVYKRTAHYRGCSDKTVKGKIGMVMAQVDRLLADKIEKRDREVVNG